MSAMRVQFGLVFVAIRGACLSALFACSPIASYAKGTVSEYVELFTNSTVRTFDGGVGTQVEYYSNDGKVFLLYPRNRLIVRGTWRITTTNDQFKTPMLCYNYTNSRSPGERCRFAYTAALTARELVGGNPLRLRQGNVPVILPKNKEYTIQELMGHAQISGVAGPNILPRNSRFRRPDPKKVTEVERWLAKNKRRAGRP